jgi:hypothetical protein
VWRGFFFIVALSLFESVRDFALYLCTYILNPVFAPRSKYAEFFQKKYFADAKTGKPHEPVTDEDIEGEFWRLVEHEDGRGVEVAYGADIATMQYGSGFPKSGDCDEAEERYVWLRV